MLGMQRIWTRLHTGTAQRVPRDLLVNLARLKIRKIHVECAVKEEMHMPNAWAKEEIIHVKCMVKEETHLPNV